MHNTIISGMSQVGNSGEKHTNLGHSEVSIQNYYHKRWSITHPHFVLWCSTFHNVPRENFEEGRNAWMYMYKLTLGCEHRREMLRLSARTKSYAVIPEGSAKTTTTIHRKPQLKINQHTCSVDSRMTKNISNNSIVTK